MQSSRPRRWKIRVLLRGTSERLWRRLRGRRRDARRSPASSRCPRIWSKSPCMGSWARHPARRRLVRSRAIAGRISGGTVTVLRVIKAAQRHGLTPEEIASRSTSAATATLTSAPAPAAAAAAGLQRQHHEQEHQYSRPARPRTEATRDPPPARTARPADSRTSAAASSAPAPPPRRPRALTTGPPRVSTTNSQPASRWGNAEGPPSGMGTGLLWSRSVTSVVTFRSRLSESNRRPSHYE